jgi:ethanolamine ammonia-lyase small subunit
MKQLRDFTLARVQLDRAGVVLATREVLAFQLAHAAARDAVHQPLEPTTLKIECEGRGWPAILVRSATPDRVTYLRRPDLGRRLSEPSTQSLTRGSEPPDLAIVLVDGLSAMAVHRHALAVLDTLIPVLDEAGWARSQIVLVEQGRVAIGDEIGERLGAKMALVLIGERPGLSSPDSLGAYLTWEPRISRTDAERNCISNIRPEGLSYELAARRIFSLMIEARRRRLTGVSLKEDLASLPSSPAKLISLPHRR